ncbi:hypothetical protein CPJCM30710_23030 [Clostridium polyendosporum]|uniref:Uncharacterized protein n=1 Tax=Clostridium polyendosporum TaxID=69208 RepID=A0A919S025_9CLOT|nr:glycosyltransferase family 1 protein [Clostridium polyendosporum]GIM29637.1 hypothetical protein CPJCM30710_23030 [Clostridium polyendosporum]
MKFCIDGLAASNLNGTNLYSYTKEIVTLLNSSDKFDAMYALWDNFPLSFYWKRLQNIQFMSLGIDRTQNDLSKLEEFLLANKIDIYHSPNNGFSIPANKVCKYITTIHTLYPVAAKEMVDEKYYTKFMNMVPHALELSDSIVVNSEFTKSELIKYFSIDENKVRVVYPKCSEMFIRMEDSMCINFLKRNYKITFPYLLYVGNITPRKNIDAIIKLLKQTKEKIKDLKLVIAGDISGKRTDYVNDIKKLIHSYNLDSDVVFLGVVKQTHLPVLYSGAVCVVDFSEYNSYPLSTVEALKCKAIVICNRTDVNSKILDQCVIFANQPETSSMAEFIHGIHRSTEYKNKVLSKLKIPLSSSDEELLSIYK